MWCICIGGDSDCFHGEPITPFPLMPKGEKLRVSHSIFINAKGGDCWKYGRWCYWHWCQYMRWWKFGELMIVDIHILVMIIDGKIIWERHFCSPLHVSIGICNFNQKLSTGISEIVHNGIGSRILESWLQKIQIWCSLY